MRERACTFGSHRGLVGIVCEPERAAQAESPVTVLFNVGLNHRVGPGRLNVELARRLAADGYASLRFDLSGLGDSEPREDVRSDTERHVVDLREAMDFLAEKRGTRSFVLMGLCSGTDGVHGATLADPRVSGAIFVDGYAYDTASYRRGLIAERFRGVIDPFRVRRYLRRRLRRLRGERPDEDRETRVPEPIFRRTYPPREEFRTAIEGFSRRGLKALFLYTADAVYFNHPKQFTMMVGWSAAPPGIEVEHWAHADHLFSTLAVRRQAVEHLAGWIEARFPLAAAVNRAGAGAA